MGGRVLRDYGPLQMAARLGLPYWQVERAVADGLIPAPDVGGGRWSAAVVDAACGRVGEIRAAVGSLPDVGARRAAEALSQRFGCKVDPDAVAELARMGLLGEVGFYKDWPIYDGRAVERFTDRAALDRAQRQGRLFTADEAAGYLRVRRCDVDHLIRAGRLQPTTWVRGAWRSRVALYRAGDLDALAADPGIDWDRVRATPRGRPSPLVRLTSGRRTR